MGASDRRKLWICRFAETTQTRAPHTHSSDREKRRKRLEDSFEEEENRNGRRLYTLISTVPGPSDGVHLTNCSSSAIRFSNRVVAIVENRLDGATVVLAFAIVVTKPSICAAIDV